MRVSSPWVQVTGAVLGGGFQAGSLVLMGFWGEGVVSPVGLAGACGVLVHQPSPMQLRLGRAKRIRGVVTAEPSSLQRGPPAAGTSTLPGLLPEPTPALPQISQQSLILWQLNTAPGSFAKL